jgi:hypothetical protein
MVWTVECVTVSGSCRLQLRNMKNPQHVTVAESYVGFHGDMDNCVARHVGTRAKDIYYAVFNVASPP